MNDIECADCGEPADGDACELCQEELCEGCLNRHREGDCPQFIDESEYDYD